MGHSTDFHGVQLRIIASPMTPSSTSTTHEDAARKCLKKTSAVTAQTAMVMAAHPTLSGPSPLFPAETVDSFELGLRGQFLDRRLSFQAAAYYYEYTNFQTSIARQTAGGAPVFDLINAGSADSYGLEFPRQLRV